MKPFDLEAALRGEKLVTRGGSEVLDFHHFKSDVSINPCAAVIDGHIFWFGTNGRVDPDGPDAPADLFMAPKTRTVYVQIFDVQGDSNVVGGKRAYAFPTKEEAERNADTTSWRVLAVAHPVEIEE